MICRERGVLPHSEYFFFNPSDMFRKYYTYVMNCGHFYCQFGYRIQRERSSFPLLIYIVDGLLHLEYDHIHHHAKKGDIILLDAENPHAYYSDKSCELLYVHYSGSFAKRITNHLIRQNQGPLFQLANHCAIYRSINALITRLYFDQEISDVELSCTIYTCLCNMQSFNEILPTISSASSDIIINTIHFIKSNIEKDLSLRLLSRQANLSPYYFSHLFKKETGSSPIEYVAMCKINFAKTMLKTTERSITDIAASLGYSSSSSFINAFTKRVGISPKKFRDAPLP